MQLNDNEKRSQAKTETTSAVTFIKRNQAWDGDGNEINRVSLPGRPNQGMLFLLSGHSTKFNEPATGGQK